MREGMNPQTAQTRLLDMKAQSIVHSQGVENFLRARQLATAEYESKGIDVSMLEGMKMVAEFLDVIPVGGEEEIFIQNGLARITEFNFRWVGALTAALTDVRKVSRHKIDVRDLVKFIAQGAHKKTAKVSTDITGSGDDIKIRPQVMIMGPVAEEDSLAYPTPDLIRTTIQALGGESNGKVDAFFQSGYKTTSLQVASQRELRVSTDIDGIDLRVPESKDSLFVVVGASHVKKMIPAPYDSLVL